MTQIKTLQRSKSSDKSGLKPQTSIYNYVYPVDARGALESP